MRRVFSWSGGDTVYCLTVIGAGIVDGGMRKIPSEPRTAPAILTYPVHPEPTPGPNLTPGQGPPRLHLEIPTISEPPQV